MTTETKAQHTPGPWEAFQNDTEGIHLVTEPHGVIVCEWIHTDADARLLAAAPEMLALLQRVRDHRTEYHGVHSDGCFVCEARALLARIEGDDHGRRACEATEKGDNARS